MKKAHKQCEGLLRDWEATIDKLDIKINRRSTVYENNSEEWKGSFWGKRYLAKSMRMIDRACRLLDDHQALQNNFDMFVDAFHVQNQKEQN